MTTFVKESEDIFVWLTKTDGDYTYVTEKYTSEVVYYPGILYTIASYGLYHVHPFDVYDIGVWLKNNKSTEKLLEWSHLNSGLFVTDSYGNRSLFCIGEGDAASSPILLQSDTNTNVFGSGTKYDITFEILVPTSELKAYKLDFDIQLTYSKGIY